MECEERDRSFNAFNFLKLIFTSIVDLSTLRPILETKHLLYLPQINLWWPSWVWIIRVCIHITYVLIYWIKLIVLFSYIGSIAWYCVACTPIPKNNSGRCMYRTFKSFSVTKYNFGCSWTCCWYVTKSGFLCCFFNFGHDAILAMSNVKWVASWSKIFRSQETITPVNFNEHCHISIVRHRSSWCQWNILLIHVYNYRYNFS